MTTLASVLSALQTAGGAVSGIKYAPAYPPEKASDFPFFVTYPTRFSGQQGPQGSMTMLYDITCELHVARKGTLPVEIATLLTYPESMAEILYETCNANILAQDGIEGTFGALRWGDIDTIGFTWILRGVKVVTNFT